MKLSHVNRLGILFLPMLLSCSSSSDLAPFSSDGCTLFPDSSPLSKADWCECCFQHDIAYWRGGTFDQRERADLALQQCVHAKTGNDSLAKLMFGGVRFGGSPYFHNWYRWGYGWRDNRKYQALTVEEEAKAQLLLARYMEQGVRGECSIISN